MEFYLRTDDAHKVIRLLGVTAKVNTLEFDGQIVIKAAGDTVTFISNNGNAGTSCKVPAEIEKEGQATVLFTGLRTFIMNFSAWDGELGAKKFHFISEGPKLTINTSNIHENQRKTKSKLTLDTLKGSSFIVEVPVESPNVILNSSLVKTAIEKGLYAVDKNSIADYVRGLRLVIADGTIRFTSTNGKVISDFAVKGENGSNNGEYFLSHEFLTGLRRLLSEDTQLFFELTRNKAIVSFDNCVYWAKSLIYKDYPQYLSVFELYDKTVEVDRAMLLSGLSSFVDVWNTDDYNRVTIELTDGKLSLKTDKSLFEYPGFQDAPEFSLDVNGKDMLDTLNALSDDSLNIKCLDEKHGMIFESAGLEDHKSYLVHLTRR